MAESGKRRRREQTRDRMLEAAADLLRREGQTALTTVRVTKEAGIVQSGFYAHFKNPEHLQSELAERIGRDLREIFARSMAALRASADDPTSLTRCYADALAQLKSESAMVDLFLRYRRTSTPLGQVMSHLHTQLRADFFQYLRDRIGRQSQPDGAVAPEHLGTIGMHADALVAALLGIVEGVVDGRVGDLSTAAAELSTLTLEPLRALLTRAGM